MTNEERNDNTNNANNNEQENTENTESIDNDNRVSSEDLNTFLVKNYNQDEIEKRLRFLEQLQKKIVQEAADLQLRSRLLKEQAAAAAENSEGVNNDDNKNSNDNDGSSEIEILNPEDNKPIEFSLVTSDSIAEPTNDNILLDSDADYNMDTKNNEVSTATKRKKTKTTKAKTRRTRKKKTSNDEEMEDFVENNNEKPKRSKKTEKESLKSSKDKGKAAAGSINTLFTPAHNFKRIKGSIDIPEICNLASLYPDEYWKNNANNGEMINFINEDCPLELVKEANIQDYSQIVGIVLSPDGEMLVTFSTIGTAKIWDVETFDLIQTLRDADEEQIDEFFVGRFTPSMEHIVIAGKLKDRKKWSTEDDDNHILPCPLKIFDVVSGKVVSRLEGHAEEVLCIKNICYKGENYYVTTSQDGYIIKWKMKSGSWTELDNYTKMFDGITCMAFTISFLPNTGNRYFIAATDGDVSLFDFESAQIIQRFVTPYSHYCDCVKIVDCLELPKPEFVWGQTNDLPTKDSPMFCYFITRGVEVLDADDDTVPSKPNRCHLEKLIYPTNEHDPFKIEDIRYFEDENYHSNSWLIKVTSNGRYIVSPTYDGKLFIFNLSTGKLTGMLHYHDGVEVRDVLFHPHKPLLFSCSDDGNVKVYRTVKKK